MDVKRIVVYDEQINKKGINSSLLITEVRIMQSQILIFVVDHSVMHIIDGVRYYGDDWDDNEAEVIAKEGVAISEKVQKMQGRPAGRAIIRQNGKFRLLMEEAIENPERLVSLQASEETHEISKMA